MVDPGFQRLGIGRDLVAAITDEAFTAGCDWVHVDYEPEYATFYERACGFRPTPAGLRSAAQPPQHRPNQPNRPAQTPAARALSTRGPACLRARRWRRRRGAPPRRLSRRLWG